MFRLYFVIFSSVLLLNGVLSVTVGKHDPAQFSSLRALPWVPVWPPNSFWPWRSARFAAREILTIPPGMIYNVQVTSAWGTWWNMSENRYGMYYVHFITRYKTPPHTRFQCAAWVHWPPAADVQLVGSPFENFNYCVPF